MEELIPIASKLQDVLGALGQSTNLDLPQIVVIGGQSSGKSSVLESVVGRSFLPRGTGIVTRRPLVLQLFNTSGDGPFGNDGGGGGNNNSGEEYGGYNDNGDDRKQEHYNESNDNNGSSEQAEWGEFLHKPGKRYYDFAQIRAEIVRDTDRLAGTGALSKGVSANPIHLKIYSPKVLSLTMVDLPGLTKVAIKGQPEDIADQILQINVQYGSNPNAILLAVTGANTDLASSDALRLARELDPRGDRTIGVLTKLDLMDPGTDVGEIMHNRVIPLRRGYIAVVNRGQRDIDADLSIQVGLRNEERYFRTHPVYSRDRSISGKCGTMNLARNLNGILIHHIRDCLPELKIRIANMMGDVQSELDALGMPDGGPRDPGQMGGKLLGLLSKFSANFAAMIDGRASNTNQHHDGMPSLASNAGGGHHGGGGGGGNGGYGQGMNGVATGMGNMNMGSSYNVSSSNNATIGTNADELYGGARISFIFHQVFSRSLNSVTAFDGLSEDEIRTTIGNANGTRPALFVPEISFDILVRRQIRRLEQPGVQCVDLVYDELQRIAAQSEPSELTRYPNLRDRMMDVVGSLLKRSVGPTQMWVSNLVRVELSYINTNHPDFIGGSRAVAKLMDKMAKDKEKAAVDAATAAASVGAPNATNYTAKGIMTPVKERNNKDKDGDVGATPLSSSSLEKYMEPSDGYSGSQNGAPPQHVVVDHGAPNNGSGDTGGLMNFIFRNNTNNNVSSANSATGGINSQNSWNNRGGIGNNQGRSTGSQYGRPSGPPTIVQLPQVPDTMRQTDAPPSDREHVEMEIIKSLIDSYFCIVRKNYIDMVPKTIMYFLVNHVKDELQNELVSELYREAEIGFLMKEAEDIALRRKTCLEMKDLLEKALEIVNEVRDFNSFAK
ncbi:dynamin family GTPase [Skeletonema marinoi]|uniref:Dynamin family GTPase n=1 Tax=Skeletonema marinoi TaxID=267567 RepID=A0AAD8Y0H3_9STRA|nr:dynamin family GTPase [Skeletonema marinoi]